MQQSIVLLNLERFKDTWDAEVRSSLVYQELATHTSMEGHINVSDIVEACDVHGDSSVLDALFLLDIERGAKK